MLSAFKDRLFAERRLDYSQCRKGIVKSSLGANLYSVQFDGEREPCEITSSALVLTDNTALILSDVPLPLTSSAEISSIG